MAWTDGCSTLLPALLLACLASTTEAQISKCSGSDQAFLELVSYSRSTDEQQRTEGRVSLVNIIDSCEDDKKAILDALLNQYSNADNAGVLNLAYILARLKRPWISQEQNKWEERLYKRFQQAKIPAERAVLNRALMNAAGLYVEALREFESATVGSPNHHMVLQNFKRTLEYPEALNIDDARYLLGIYFLRNFVDEAKPPEAAKVASSADLAEALKHFSDVASKPLYSPPRYTLSSWWHMAVIQYWRGDTKAALEYLRKIENLYRDEFSAPTRMVWNHTLYYLRVFHHPELPRVNEHIPFDQLVARMKGLIEKEPPRGTPKTTVSFSDVQSLAKNLAGFFEEAETYFLLLNAYPNRKRAEERVEQLKREWSKNSERPDLGKELTIYPPWTDRSVYTVGTRLRTLEATQQFYRTNKSLLIGYTAITKFY